MDYYLIALIMFAGAFLQGITGFGSGLVAVPLLSLLLPLTMLTPMLSLINVALAVYLAWLLRHYLALRRWGPLFVAGIFGTLLGNYALAYVPLATLQLGMAIFVISAGLLFWFGIQLRLPARLPQQTGIGLLSGFANGALTLGGPPVVLFLTANRLARSEFRATLAVFFLALGMTNVVSFGLQGRYATIDPLALLVLIVGALLGAYGGHRLSGKLSEQGFRRLTLLLVIGAGIMVIIGR
ncbi:sulfite exporter TauE/SafE family protein [Pseudidiomarina sp. CB1]|uniref:sulfite exporter TauE/SafE family protein n=1 Tax=Pseudidiomarina sp. CB1 TaxID=2972484 RepID=UPI0021612DAE|nr:sulfite exporter TauE/SafE family protein [Pseudidiomarina sp. CB1]